MLLKPVFEELCWLWFVYTIFTVPHAAKICDLEFIFTDHIEVEVYCSQTMLVHQTRLLPWQGLGQISSLAFYPIKLPTSPSPRHRIISICVK